MMSILEFWGNLTNEWNTENLLNFVEQASSMSISFAVYIYIYTIS